MLMCLNISMMLVMLATKMVEMVRLLIFQILFGLVSQDCSLKELYTGLGYLSSSGNPAWATPMEVTGQEKHYSLVSQAEHRPPRLCPSLRRTLLRLIWRRDGVASIIRYTIKVGKRCDERTVNGLLRAIVRGGY